MLRYVVFCCSSIEHIIHNKRSGCTSFSDPDSGSDYSDNVYMNQDFTRALSSALKDDGVLVAQVGEAVKIQSPGLHLTSKSGERIFTTNLIANGFEAYETYEEAHGGFMSSWSFIIVFKSLTDNYWNANQAEIDATLRKRAMQTVDGSSPFRYYDGATHMGYQYPSRVREQVFCRDDPTPPLCIEGHGFNPDRPNAPISTFEVKNSTIQYAGRGVFTTKDIAKGSYLAVDESIYDMFIKSTSTDLIRRMLHTSQVRDYWQILDAYMIFYGFEQELSGGPSYAVDPGIFTFINHGCNGTYVSGTPYAPRSTLVTELEADPLDYADDIFPPVVLNLETNVYARRNEPLFMFNMDIAIRDIQAGEEILDNYLIYYTEDQWEEYVTRLKVQCSSKEGAAGPVAEYERKTQQK